MEPHTQTVKFWNENREKANDPAFWMAHPLCRRAINRRVSGSPHEWPLDWFKRVHAAVPFRRGITWGCGLGAFERAVIRSGIVARIDAFDVSEASLADARRLADGEGLDGITYGPGNFDDPQIPRSTYDVAFFHASLHHVSALERLFRRLTLALRRGGAIYVDEYIGPSRFDWSADKLRLAQELLDAVPAEGKLSGTVLLPIQHDDPSEAFRSSEISGFLRTFVDLREWRPYGGQLVDLIMPNVRREWTETPEGCAFVAKWLDIEDEQIREDPESSHHVVAYGTVKPPYRLLRPLGSQAAAAIRRRMPQLGWVGRRAGGRLGGGSPAQPIERACGARRRWRRFRRGGPSADRRGCARAARPPRCGRARRRDRSRSDPPPSRCKD